MAPQFTTLMYQVYAADNEVHLIVGFPIGQSDSIFPFRDKLAEAFLKMSDLQVHRTQGNPLPPDSLLRFFTKKHGPTLEQFLHKKRPRFLSRLFNAADWVAYEKETKSVEELIEAEIETSHDFPCIVVQSRIHSEKTLSKMVQEVARDLGMEISRNTELSPIQAIVTSNGRFDL